MSGRAPLIATADRDRAIPAAAGARADRIAAALAALGDEQRRLERLGFEDSLRRCHQERRYWSFVGAMYAIAEAGRAPRAGRGR